MPAATKPVLLINPLSGDGKACSASACWRAARARGIECHEFGPGIDLAGTGLDAPAPGADAVGVAGGDGSAAIVADLGEPGVCADGLHPVGTRNHFAMDLGLDRADPVAALDAPGDALA